MAGIDDEELPGEQSVEVGAGSAVPGPPTAAGAEVILGEQAWLAKAMLPDPARHLPTALTHLLRRGYLPLVIAGMVLPLITAVAGWVTPTVLLLALGTAADVLGTRVGAKHQAILHRSGVTGALRQLLRSVVGLVLIVNVSDRDSDAFVVGYLVVAALVQVYCFTAVLGSRWLGPRAPMLLFQPHGAHRPSSQNPTSVGYARLHARATTLPVLPLALDLLTLLALALAHRHPTLLTVALVVTVVAAVVIGVLVLGQLRQLRALSRGAARANRLARAAIAATEPTALIYMTGGVGQSKYILNQWLPAFAEMGQSGVVVCREASQLPPITDVGLPVVYAPSTRHVEELVLPTVRVAFYLANAGKNVHLQREAGIKHVFLNHGDSDKSTSANPVARVYDEVWVAGQAAVDRYHAAGVRISQDHFAVVGRPQVQPLTVGPLTGPDGRRPVLLYAPTFEGYYEESNYSSLERMGPQMIRQIMADFPQVSIWCKPHPSSGVQRRGMRVARAQIAELLRSAPPAQGHRFVDDHPELTLVDCFAQADVLISDISSVVTDFLYTERPLLVSNPRSLSSQAFGDTFPTQRASYVVSADLANLGALLTDALGADSMAAARRAMKIYVLGDLPQGPMAAFAEHTARIIAAADQDRALISNEFRIRNPESS